MVKELVKYNRSYRRFFQDEKISKKDLVDLVDLARLTPSGKNLQAHKFILSNKVELNEKIFETLVWAGYLPEWPGPEEGEKPSAYIVILGDKSIEKNLSQDFIHINSGIISQSILLGAAEKKIGGCIFASIQRKKLAENLELSENYEIMLVIALGKPKEQVVIDEIGKNEDIKYWRDEDMVHHVPKRKLDDLFL